MGSIANQRRESSVAGQVKQSDVETAIAITYSALLTNKDKLGFSLILDKLHSRAQVAFCVA